MKDRITLSGDNAEGLATNPQVIKVLCETLQVKDTNLSFDWRRVSDGYPSIVVPLLDNLKDLGYVLKLPKIGREMSVQEALQSLCESGIDSEGVWVLGQNPSTKTEEIIQLGCTDSIYYIPEGTNIDIKRLIILLRQFPQGSTLLELQQRGISLNAQQIYYNAGKAIRKIHDLDVSSSALERWNVIGAPRYLHYDHRVDFTRAYLKENFPEIYASESLDKTSSKITQMSQIRADRCEIVRTHGDCWEANWWVPDNSTDVIPFDPGHAYGLRGDDLGFGIGRQLISYLLTSDDINRNTIEAFLQGYDTGSLEPDSRQSMWRPIVLKFLIGAAFDHYTEDERRRLIRVSNRMANFAIDNPDISFSLVQFHDLWEEKV